MQNTSQCWYYIRSIDSLSISSSAKNHSTRCLTPVKHIHSYIQKGSFDIIRIANPIKLQCLHSTSPAGRNMKGIFYIPRWAPVDFRSVLFTLNVCVCVFCLLKTSSIYNWWRQIHHTGGVLLISIPTLIPSSNCVSLFFGTYCDSNGKLMIQLFLGRKFCDIFRYSKNFVLFDFVVYFWNFRT